MCQTCLDSRAALRTLVPAILASTFSGMQLFGKILTAVTDSQHAVQEEQVDQDVAWEALKQQLLVLIVDNTDENAIKGFSSLVADLEDVVGMCLQGIAQREMNNVRVIALTDLMASAMGGGQQQQQQH